ncbi:CHAT domain-containing protein [Rivularia sp. UHCC 0363]|uniref:CHAT domain-containing protein n=1 Tax=Rivularia sp. UHCC 0363 TaxID=3110244 RepID=UPI002B20BD47|nr:tetratricopeptide repeat protein [Rivularia sp. UHCC 0363]MEA5599310.1 tetratricopeptide repeat protein [Rivularia sp. UHCC 0363]
MQTARKLPELTNSDLEFLFTQLLEGVNQARGQHWAQRWLQNLEHRVSQQRWLEWLQYFGNKLLASAAPNHELASRMVDLGELEIGEIGDVAYDIGVQLLTRNAKQQPAYSIPISTEFEGLTSTPESQQFLIEPVTTNAEQEFDVEWEEPIVESIATNGEFDTVISLEDSPGQNLIREFGELLWENYEPNSNAIAPANTGSNRIHAPLDDFSEALYEQVFEYEEDESVETSENTHIEAFEELSDIPEQVQEVTSGEDLIRNLGELLWEEETLRSDRDVNTSEQEFINDLSDLVWDYPEQNQEDTVADEIDTTFVPIQDSVEDADETFNALLELAEEVEADEPETEVVEPTSVEPTVTAIDQLLVRLDESASLVEELASGLGERSATLLSLNDAIVDDDAAQAAEAWFYQGLSQARAGNLELAIESYEKAVQIKPDVHEYWFNRGLTLFHLGQLEDAIASYDKAIKIKHDFYKGWYNRGRALGELGFLEEAIVSFNTAIEIRPNYQEAWSSNGLALLKLGRVDEAIFSYDKSLELEPLDPENWYYRGVALSGNANYRDAVESYDKALELEPYLHDAWVDRGVAQGQLGEWPQAIASWDEALKIRPDFYLTWFNRAVALDNLGSREDAIASYDKALEIEPNFHIGWYNRAVALFYIEQYEQSILCYDRALEIKADYWEAWLGRGSAADKSQHFDWELSLSSPVAGSNSALNARGEEGKLTSYLEALKYVSHDTQPEGWGRLHLAIANCYYDIGKRYSTPRDYWYEAVNEYNQALEMITADAFPELHLEVLQNFIKVLVGLRETTQAQELHQYSTDFLQELLTQANRSDDSRKQLTLKNIGFEQLAVEIAIQFGEIVQGLEIAEHGKNACLTWLLYGWTDRINSPNYSSILQLLNPTTAAIYWHISPSSLRTFIIKPNAPEPIPVFTPMLNVAPGEYPLPEAVNRLVEFEDWLQEWNREYGDYRGETRNKQSKIDHSWRKDMEQRLARLREILCIASIEQELQGIDNLILIPHRDLHRFPLHGLFSAKFAISYLPSLQIGLNLQQQKSKHNKSSPRLLSVEHPDTKDYPPFKSAKIAALAISQMFDNPHRIQGTEATKLQVENALTGYNIFNFYGYANDSANPANSEILLTWEDKISLNEICKKPLNRYSLFTLPACEIATNKQNITTEYAGLTSGLLSQGVTNVVNSLWRVESTANALVTIEFYRRLRSGETSVVALKEAVEWLRELTAGELTKWYESLLNQLPPEGLRMKAQLATQLYRTSQMEADTKLYSHPYYWAAFVIGGASN